MLLRVLLLLIALSAPLTALAQPIGQGSTARPPISPFKDLMACDSLSLGQAQGLLDIDQASCRPVAQLEDVDTQNRIVWVKGHIDIEPGFIAAAPVGLFTGALASREIWWNGVLIGSVGQVGATPRDEIPGDLDAVTWAPPRVLRAGANEIAIRYSTFHLAMPVVTPLHYVGAGPMGGTRSLLREYGPGLAATGALVAAALFFGFTFIASRSPGSLFIVLMATATVGQLWLETLRGFMSFPYPFQIWRLSAVGVLALVFGLALAAYVAHRFTQRRWRAHVLAALALGLALWPLLPGFDGMALGFILGPSVVSLVAALRGVSARLPEARATAIALAAFITLQLVEDALFLDRTFYVAVSLLMLVLILDQARVLRRARIAEEQARRRATLLELELLRRRIAPHFLMNTLNALTEWVESDPKTGVKMIEALAEEFRLLSHISDRALVPLGEEIALCRSHLAVMSYRVDRPFSLSVRDVDEAVEVPPGVLHTLVENAFTHGRFADGGEFILTCEEAGEASRLVLLTPPASERAPASAGRGGEGLAYVSRRLEAAFGPAARVESGADGASWRTIITLPQAGVAT